MATTSPCIECSHCSTRRQYVFPIFWETEKVCGAIPSPVTGKPYMQCSVARSFGAPCGPTARLFESRRPTLCK